MIAPRIASTASDWRGHGRQGRSTRLALHLLLGGVLVLGAGCAARRGTPPPSPVSEPSAPEETAGDDHTGRPPRVAPTLPGSARVWPSQDPRNQADVRAPEAFPKPQDAGTVRTKANPAEADAAATGRAAAGAERTKANEDDGYAVQILATSSRAGADKAARLARKRLPKAEVAVDEQRGIYRVRAGPFATRERATEFQATARKSGYRDAFIVRLR